MGKLENSKIFYLFAVLLGRLPIWAVLLYFYLNQEFGLRPAIYFIIVCLFGKGCLDAYEKNGSFIFSSVKMVFKYILRPVFSFIFVYISIYATIFVFFYGNTTDIYLLAGAFGAFILSLISVFLAKPAISNQTLIRRSTSVKICVALLWLYAVAVPDEPLFKVIAVCFACLIELVTNYKINTTNEETAPPAKTKSEQAGEDDVPMGI